VAPHLLKRHVKKVEEFDFMNTLNLPNLAPIGVSILKAAQAVDATVLITGATGTGKSHLAEQIHHADTRRGGRKLIKVNLATLSENLIESELFGHERGAFTGADFRRVGKLESADGGTVFLDEIGEMPVRLQSKLLDFIQYKKITPVGSNRELNLNVRILAATNRNLEAAVKAGSFREDLFHRLNVFRVHLSDLANTPQVALDMARELILENLRRLNKPDMKISRDLQSVIRHYPWPGNIRELRNALEFAVAMEPTAELQLTSMPVPIQTWVREGGLGRKEELPVLMERPMPATQGAGFYASSSILELPVNLNFKESKAQFEKRYIEYILRACNGQINLTSRRAGLNKVSLTEKIKIYGIDWRRIRFESTKAADVSRNQI